MSVGRLVPASESEIFPDGAGFDYPDSDQSDQARSTSYAIEPVILLPPSNQIAVAGSDVTFTILASGTSQLRYRWWFDRTNALAWATNDTLGLTNVQPSQGGSYHAVVSNISDVATNALAALIVDSDGDGMPDTWELAHDLDPAFGLDALLDLDGAGMTNLEEYKAGTNPRDPRSNSRVELILAPQDSNNTAAITFQAIRGRSYAVQFKDRLDSSVWQTLTSLPPTTADQRLAVQDRSGSEQPQRFYRLLSPPP